MLGGHQCYAAEQLLSWAATNKRTANSANIQITLLM